MTVSQGLIGAITGLGGGGGGPPPPYAGTDFFWSGDADYWVAFGGINANSVYSNPAPANPAYTYPDNSYTGKTRDFTGSEYMISMNLGIGGAWTPNNNAIVVNFWFYPTANGVQLLGERNEQNISSGYHYSILEITSGNYIKAAYYSGGGYPSNALTSTNTVNLNAWNHIWFREDTQGGHSFELNGVATNGNPNYTRAGPGATSEYFIIGDSDVTNMGNTGRFQGKVGYLTISDYDAPSEWSTRRTRFGL